MKPIKTIQAIEDLISSDQGSSFRKHLREFMPLAEDAYRETEDSFRSHLGASLIGRECPRELWYSFRWSTKKNFDSRMVRLFNRGHLEEPRFLAILKAIGCQVWQTDVSGKQFRIKGYRDHYGGSIDGVVIGIPDLPQGTPALTEFKTHGEKSFLKLQKEGVVGAKWEHFIQQQQYMGYYKLPWSLYMAVNKNTDELYLELIPYDEQIDLRYQARAASIVDATAPPPKLDNRPSWFKCKFCDHHAVCHMNKKPEKTCRSCQHSIVLDAGQWGCTLKREILAKETQLIGCKEYLISESFKKP